MDRIVSSHSIWLFDTERKRFRRVPRDADPDAPALESDWEPYYSLEIEEETGAFTVTLNEDGTRLLRSYREDAEPPAAPGDSGDSGDATAELRLERGVERGHED